MLKKLTTEEVSEVRGGFEVVLACIDTCKGQCEATLAVAESKSDAWERNYL